MPNILDERAKIEIRLATHLEIALVAVDATALAYINRRVAELEQQRRELEATEPASS
jgi:hypothetical protein